MKVHSYFTSNLGALSIAMMFLMLESTVLISQSVNHLQTENQSEDKKFISLNKGTALVGFTGGTNVRESENEQTIFVKIDEQSKNGYNILFSGGYFVKELFATGLALGLDRYELNQISENSDGVITELNEASSILTTAAFIKNYIPLSSNLRFYLYNLTGLGYSNEAKISESFSQNILTRTYTEKNTLRIGVSPGIAVFIMKGFVTELGINIAGLSGSQTKITENGVENGNINKLDINLKINLLAINLSFYYYFPTKHYEKR